MRSNRSCPTATVIPEFAYPNIGEAIEWLTDRFGFTLRLRIGDHRAQLNVGDGAIVLTELRAGASVGGGHSVMVRVESVDQHHRHALARGVRIVRQLADHPYGERQYTAVDLAGHIWTFTESIADVDPVSWGGTPGKL